MQIKTQQLGKLMSQLQNSKIRLDYTQTPMTVGRSQAKHENGPSGSGILCKLAFLQMVKIIQIVSYFHVKVFKMEEESAIFHL
ncbi:MAG: hypothetical protein COX51_09260 [Syntrophobacteraceae bacterium CG23_combo_of_CG06-09_8_20_14_all_50_8]|nr:MAG: hypothetical protein COX51_09260 [Syntrophobacteraceae bacterium CG23_combo_of_CG06-09_8_20_14_all_50_8]